jgi:hypothetical protein
MAINCYRRLHATWSQHDRRSERQCSIGTAPNVHRYLPDDDPNFSIRDPEPSDPDDDPFANDPEARRRPTRKEVRYDLIRRMYRAYMAPHPRVPEFRQTTTEAVRQIIEGYQDHFGIEISESTVYRALGLRRPKKKRSRHNS